MTIADFLLFLLIAGVIGAVGQAVAGYSMGGCLISILLGYGGALLGALIARSLGLPELINIQVGATAFPVVWSIIGSALLVAVAAFLTRPRRAI